MNEPSLTSLRVFCNVAQHGSFSEAARVLHISQSALSRTIKLLEEMLDARLFERTSRRVMLTAAGATLLPVAERLTSEFAAAFKGWRRRLGNRDDCLTVSVDQAVSPEIFSAIARHFRDGRLGAKVIVLDEVLPQLREQLLTGDVNFAITTDPGKGAGVGFKPIYQEKLGLVCSRDFAGSSGGLVPWSVFEEHAVAVMCAGAGLRQVSDEAFARADVTPRITYECSHLTVVAGLVAAGAAVSLWPASAMGMFRADSMEWRAMELPAAAWRVGAVWPEGAETPPAVRAFVSTVSSAWSNTDFLDGNQSRSGKDASPADC